MLPVAHGSPLSIGKRYYGELNSPRSWYHSFLSPGLAAASEMISSLPDAPLLYFPAPSRLDFPLERFYKKLQSDGWIYFDHGADEGLHIHRNPLPQKTTVFYASTVKINITKAHYGSDLIMPQCQKILMAPEWPELYLKICLLSFTHHCSKICEAVSHCSDQTGKWSRPGEVMCPKSHSKVDEDSIFNFTWI